MATMAGRARQAGDARFFLIGAIVMAAVIVAGFSTQLAMGRSSFAVPVAIHIHALLFFGWTFFFVAQAALAASGSSALHRRLGWIGAGWAAAVVVVGIYTTAMMVRRGGAPFFFQPNYFLFMNSLTVLAFGGLTAAAIAMRRRTDWHRRLLFCGMAILTGPGLGRLLPMPLMIPWAGWGVFVAVMLFPLAGMIADRRRTGRVHRAWLWGAGTILVIQIAIDLIAFSAPGLAVYRAVTSGSPGAAVPPLAFPPAPPPFGP
ncbi:hypothetical protein PQ455_12720 [Sphingomonas naphthae]|uniref:DUF2306 domain-containing protein n=1 Tax=Sphingomonas naphthae TaxID=1813468 RepID=A0ABY7THU0_9SPHN|nr:hypothetical protein [Sphingomonas naphthae]WCT72495.1 hypothetical protein PQ455_12720 [Sphingomonas naphthae]